MVTGEYCCPGKLHGQQDQRHHQLYQVQELVENVYSSENNWSKLLLKIRRQGNVLKSHEEVSARYNVFHRNIDADNGRVRATPEQSCHAVLLYKITTSSKYCPNFAQIVVHVYCIEFICMNKKTYLI